MDKLLELRAKAAKWLLCTEAQVDHCIVGVISIIGLIMVGLYLG